MTDQEFDPANEDPELRLRLSRLPRHDAPAALMADLRQKYMGSSPRSGWKTVRAWLTWPTMWKPASAFATALVIGALWFTYQKKQQEDVIDLNTLLAVHSLNQSQSLVPDSDMTASNYSAQLASYYGND